MKNCHRLLGTVLPKIQKSADHEYRNWEMRWARNDVWSLRRYYRGYSNDERPRVFRTKVERAVKAVLKFRGLPRLNGRRRLPLITSRCRERDNDRAYRMKWFAAICTSSLAVARDFANAPFKRRTWNNKERKREREREETGSTKFPISLKNLIYLNGVHPLSWVKKERKKKKERW